MGFKPIANLSGHSLEQYTIHAGKSIPNIWSIGGFSLSENSAYACEPFVTTEQGGGFVRNGQIKNIFAINSRKKTKNEEADKLLGFYLGKFQHVAICIKMDYKRMGRKESKRIIGNFN